MKKIKIYDPAMCCSTGICGPSVNQELITFQATLTSLSNLGFDVVRFNLGHQPKAFTENKKVLEAMGNSAEKLPIITIDDEIWTIGKYPSKEDFFNHLKVEIKNTKLNVL